VRQYATARLEDAGERSTLRERHYAWCLELARASQQHFTTTPETMRYWADRLEEEIDNFRAALTWCVAPDRPDEETAARGVEAAMRLVNALHWLWQDGHMTEGQAWCDRLLDEPGAGAVPPDVYRLLLDEAGFLARRRADFPRATRLHERQLELTRQLGDRMGISATLWGLAAIARDTGDYERANALYAENLALIRELGSTLHVGQTLADWGIALAYQGDADAAETCLREVLEIGRRPGTATMYGQAVAELTDVALLRGDLVAARAWAEEALSFSRRINRAWAIGNALAKLGRVALALGDALWAYSLWHESLELFQAQADRRYVLSAIEGLAHAAQQREASEHAARLLGAAAAWRDTLGIPLPPADRPSRDRLLAQLRATLGDELLERFLQAGRALTLEAAVALALEPIES
jgi:tetratricopeptide (TPR) repeat protein